MCGVLFFWPLMGAMIGYAASTRNGMSPVAGLIGGCLLGPLAFLLYFASGSGLGDDRKKCPECAEWVAAAAKVCKHCRADLAAVPGPPKSKGTLLVGVLVLTGLGFAGCVTLTLASAAMSAWDAKVARDADVRRVEEAKLKKAERQRLIAEERARMAEAARLQQEEWDRRSAVQRAEYAAREEEARQKAEETTRKAAAIAKAMRGRSYRGAWKAGRQSGDVELSIGPTAWDDGRLTGHMVHGNASKPVTITIEPLDGEPVIRIASESGGLRQGYGDHPSLRWLYYDAVYRIEVTPKRGSVANLTGGDGFTEWTFTPGSIPRTTPSAATASLPTATVVAAPSLTPRAAPASPRGMSADDQVVAQIARYAAALRSEKSTEKRLAAVERLLQLSDRRAIPVLQTAADTGGSTSVMRAAKKAIEQLESGDIPDAKKPDIRNEFLESGSVVNRD